MRPSTRGFLWGVVIGVAGTWAWHAFASPLPRAAAGG